MPRCTATPYDSRIDFPWYSCKFMIAVFYAPQIYNCRADYHRFAAILASLSGRFSCGRAPKSTEITPSHPFQVFLPPFVLLKERVGLSAISTPDFRRESKGGIRSSIHRSSPPWIPSPSTGGGMPLPSLTQPDVGLGVRDCRNPRPSNNRFRPCGNTR